MEAKEIGGALAGGLLAIELMDKLISKGVLTKEDSRSMLHAAIKVVGPSPVMPPAAKAALDALTVMAKQRFPDG
jgi:hypothetical protein